MNIEEYIYWLIKYYAPVMVANGFPVLVIGKHRIDGDKVFIDGKPIFGSNKTIEGLIVGVSGAYILSSSISIMFENLLLIPILTGAGLFALLGDLLGAFIKRRLDIKPGSPAPILDQLDFLVISTLYYYALRVEEFVDKPLYVGVSILIIASLHVITNLVAYALGLKHSKF